MIRKRKILAIVGSASIDSSNHRLMQDIANSWGARYEVNIIPDLSIFPHFDPVASVKAPPPEILTLRDQIVDADGVIICTPEYLFSIPARLKNLMEWCVSTTVFSDKPVGLITASASGDNGHAEMQLILHTLMAKTSPATFLLIKGAKGKIDEAGKVTDEVAKVAIDEFMTSFEKLIAS